MSHKDEYQRLASQFVDMWQKNVAAMMNDSEFIRTFLQMMQSAPYSAKEKPAYENPFTQSAAGASAAFNSYHAATSGIESRLTVIESRIDRIEQTLAAFFSAAAAKPATRMDRAAKRPKARRSSGKGSRKKNG